MALWGAAEPAIGTNPIALAAPCGDGDPILLDVATSVVSRNTINLARERAAPIPYGWALDREGWPTDRPEDAAALLPFGDHKGSGLALFVEILCALISGGASRREVGRLFFEMDRPERSCHFFAAIDLGQVADTKDYGDRVQEMARSLRALRPAAGVDRILLPGDREFAVEREYLREGVPLDPAVARDLFAAGDSLGVRRPAQTLGTPIPPGTDDGGR